MRDGNEKRVVLAMTDVKAADTLCRSIEHSGMHIVGIAESGAEAIEWIRQTSPDAVIADMVLPGLDGCGLINRITKLPLNTMPVVLLLSMKELAVLNEQALRAGAHRVFLRPVDLVELTDALNNSGIDARLKRVGIDEKRIDGLLSALGLPARLKGTGYLKTAVMLAAVDGRRAQALTTKLYPLVAERHGTDAKTVERAMRRAIESAWSAGALDAQHALFGNTIDARRGKPTCGEMIARVSDLLRAKE